VTDQRKAFFVWLARHHAEAEALHEVAPDIVSRLWADAFREGSWAAIKENTQLGLDLTRVLERMEELAALYRETEIDREMDEVSAYWKTEVDV